MELFEALLNRRSVRAFTAAPVGEDAVATLLEAAMHAPSAGNQRPWHFLVIRDRKILDAIPGVHPYAAMVGQAPVAILVCGGTQGLRHPDYWEQDCAAATQNLMLAAHGLGLGSVWVGLHPRASRVEALRSLLPLPEGIIPFALIPVGQPNEPLEKAERYQPERIHHDRW